MLTQITAELYGLHIINNTKLPDSKMINLPGTAGMTVLSR